MASYLHPLLPLLLLILHVSQASHFPYSIVFPLNKDVTTLQYVTQLHLGTPGVKINLVVDLNGPFTWVASDSIDVSTYQRMTTGRPSFSSDSNTCGLCPENSFTRVYARGELAEGIITVRSQTGLVSTVDHFLFSTAPPALLTGLASGTNGMLGLGRTRLSLQSQLTGSMGLGICLSPSNGVVSLWMNSNGNLPVPRSLTYTPLVINLGNSASKDYYIKVTSIKINNKLISTNFSSPWMDGEGRGRTKLSTVLPYTTLETSIYATFTKAFINAATFMNMTMVTPVTPFRVCFRAKNDYSSWVPVIDLVLQSKMVKWRIYRENSMVRVSDEVMCLGFLDGGPEFKGSIVLGSHQLEDNYLHFDVGRSMLGFSSSLLLRHTSCSNISLSHVPLESI
ncbi:Xylanase inhibitor, N-terminal [Dillenia turbinata]|uniref:Xylanase inhibitor, N-terminal n=1 Tax=Dillenia turbinata TaxID=194707 RepID=A0AAN8VHH5_9MAGN